jgi:MFS family permease
VRAVTIRADASTNAARVASRPRLSMAVAFASTTLSVLPVLLTGALGILLRPELGMTRTDLGAVISAHFAMSALASIPGGRLAHRLGPEAAISVGAAGSGLTLLGIGALARDGWSLLMLLLLAGVANAVSQPAANALVAQDQPQARHGITFGLLQTAIPFATVVAGFTLPFVGANAGWRFAYLGAAAAAFILAAFGFTRRRAATHARPRAPAGRTRVARPALYLLALAGGCAAAPGNALATFYVDSAVAAGLSVTSAGLWLVLGSIIGMIGRLGWGWVIDRWPGRPLRLMSLLLIVGSLGMVLLALDDVLWLGAGTILAFGAGWAWKGLFNLSIVQQYPLAPSAAVGVTQAGVFTGSVFGPIGFALLLEQGGFRLAWVCTGGVLLTSPLVISVVRRMLRRRALLLTVDKEQSAT